MISDPMEQIAASTFPENRNILPTVCMYCVYCMCVGLVYEFASRNIYVFDFEFVYIGVL